MADCDEAFKDLEPMICNLALMAGIAFKISFDPLAGTTGDEAMDEARERAMFAINHLVDMAEDLKRHYYEQYELCVRAAPDAAA